MPRTRSNAGFLRGTRVYLSGPMDFVASRAQEKRAGWRVRVASFLRSFGAVVFDPWSKPDVRGLQEYGREDVAIPAVRSQWCFSSTSAGAKRRAMCADAFWQTMHIDLRMVDVSDFVVAYCPTNVYSVGTPHEIIVARQQHKPVLFVSPPVAFPALEQLRAHLRQRQDQVGSELLQDLEQEVPIKSNPEGIPSLWYMPLVGGDNFFDGFGFSNYMSRFGWAEGPLDQRDREHPPARPLLPFLVELNRRLPKRWSVSRRRFVQDEDWLLLDIESQNSQPSRGDRRSKRH
jgi:hypothetical protein